MCPFLHTESFCSFTSIRHFILLQLEGFIEHSNILSILYDTTYRQLWKYQLLNVEKSFQNWILNILFH